MESAVYHEWKAQDDRRRNASFAACVASLLLGVSCVALVAQSMTSSSGAAVPAPPRAESAPTELDEFETVWLPIGAVKGTREVLVGGESPRYGRFFRGVPYARAGRFEKPREPEPVAVLDATRFGTACMRPQGRWMEDMSEDCLYLNIFAPSHPPSTDGRLKSPVAVWFHGGSYTMGAGSDTHVEHVAALVVTHKVIVVTINYRLGVFGFLGSNNLRSAEDQSTGNFGTLDQQMALKWVNKHIEHFGGDLSRITVFGWSAGAAAASVHLSMPSSRGLFGSVIMMSGGFTDWAAQSLADAEQDYDLLLNKVGCGQEAECRAVGPPCKCLMEADARELLAAELAVPVTWAPVVDGAVLHHQPIDALALGEVHKNVSIIIGTTLEDALVDIGAQATPTMLEEYLQTVLLKHRSPATVEAAMKLYLDQEAPGAAVEGGSFSHEGYSPAYWAARQAASDHGMTCVARRAARLWHKATGASAYWYLWAEGSLPSYFALPAAAVAADAAQLAEAAGARARRRLAGLPRAGEPRGSTAAAAAAAPRPSKLTVSSCWPCPGATHGSDLPFLFEGPGTNVARAMASLADIYHTMFADFMRHGDPNRWLNGFSITKDGHSAWPTAEQGGMRFLAGAAAVDPALRGRYCDFWDGQVATLV